MDLSRPFHTRILSQTMLSPFSTTRCKRDPQPHTRSKEPTPLVSRWDPTSLLPSSISPRDSFGNIMNRHDRLRSLSEAAAEKKRHQEILELTKEIERLSSENIQLQEETFEADSNYLDMIDRLETKESEIEDLKTELNRLSEQIVMSTTKEEEYTARTCMNLEEQIEKLQKDLIIQRKEYERLSSAHAACPSPEGMDSALKDIESTYSTRLTAVSDQLCDRDRLIAELEEKIAKKDEDLNVMASELTRQRSDFNVSEIQREALETKLSKMDSVVQDRERLIANMKILMGRKSVKVNLLLLRIKELEVKLEICHKQLREYHQAHGIRDATTTSTGFKDFEHLWNTWSLENVFESTKKECNHCYHGAGDSNVEEDDSQGLLDETSKLQSDIANTTNTTVGDAARLLVKINNIKSKISHKLDREIVKRNHVSQTIGVSQGQFDRTQSEIEEIRKHQRNAEESRQQIRNRVIKEKQLSEIMECSENEIRVMSAKIASFERALRNLKNLETFLIQTENKT